MSGAGPLQPDYFRYRRGDSNSFVSPPIDIAQVIRIGHNVFKDLADASKFKSFNQVVNIGGIGPATLAAAQELVHDTYAGVSSERSLAGEVFPVKINATGVHEFECASATFNLGQLVGAALNPLVANALAGDRVIAVATPNLAVGRVSKQYTLPTTSVEVEIMSTLIYAGPQAVV